MIICCFHHHTHFNYVGHVCMLYQKKGLTGRKVIVTRQHSLHPVGCILKRSDAWTLAQCCRWQGEIRMSGLFFLSFLFLFAVPLCSVLLPKLEENTAGWRVVVPCEAEQNSKIKAIKGTQIEVGDGSREIKALEQNQTLCFLAAQNLSARGQSFLHLSGKLLSWLQVWSSSRASIIVEPAAVSLASSRLPIGPCRLRFLFDFLLPLALAIIHNLSLLHLIFVTQQIELH